MRIVEYSGVAVGVAMLFLAGMVIFAIHAPIHTSTSGWTTTVTVESPSDPGTSDSFAVLPGGHVVAVEAR
jgi:hypothetical protein